MWRPVKSLPRMSCRILPASDGFAEFLRDQFAPLGHITMRRMFGKTGVFCDGFMLGMVRDNTLYLRVDDHNRVAFKEAASFPPLNYMKKGDTSIFPFGVLRSACSTNPMSLSPGREQRWRRRGGLRRENRRRAGGDQACITELEGTEADPSVSPQRHRQIERAGQTITAT